MKNVWIALLFVLLVTSCLPEKIGKKDSEPELAGTYQITSFVSNGVTLIPQSGVSGAVNVTKNSDTQISVSFSVNNNGRTANDGPVQVSISKSGGSGYDLVENGVRIGSIDGTTFSLNSGGVSLSAKK